MAILLNCLLSLFAIVPQASSQFPTKGSLPMVQRIAQDGNFSIQNQTTINVGWAAILLSDYSDDFIDVTGLGTFSTTLSLGPTQCTINGQSFGYGSAAWIQISIHTAVHATWTGNVIVIDQEETN